jgi:hypothetical protein
MSSKCSKFRSSEQSFILEISSVFSVLSTGKKGCLGLTHSPTPKLPSRKRHNGRGLSEVAVGGEGGEGKTESRGWGGDVGTVDDKKDDKEGIKEDNESEEKFIPVIATRKSRISAPTGSSWASAFSMAGPSAGGQGDRGSRVLFGPKGLTSGAPACTASSGKGMAERGS